MRVLMIGSKGGWQGLPVLTGASLLLLCLPTQERMLRLGVQQTVETFNALLAAASSSGRLEEGLEVLEEMRVGSRRLLPTVELLGTSPLTALTETLSVWFPCQVMGISPDVVSYSTLISGCSQAGGRWEEAVQLFAEMRESGVQPNLVTFNSLLTTCRAAGQWQPALQVPAPV